MAESFVYVQSKEHRWVPARVIEKLDDEHIVVDVPIYSGEQHIASDGGENARFTESRTIKLADYPNKVLPLQNVNDEGKLVEVEDMVNLSYLHEAAILYNLKARHVQDKPYTRSGDIVFAVNPYYWLHHLYTREQRMSYSTRLVWTDSLVDARASLEPHVYETSAMAFKGLLMDKQNQSILVSGESGAGKTETVKLCLDHLAMMQRGPGSSGGNYSAVVQRILDSNALLETFGNARTRRNDNSSRFGKYIQLHFTMPSESQSGAQSFVDSKLVGSHCQVYLLEKNRVVYHDVQERSFHIFYELLASPDRVKARFWEKLKGKSTASFYYLADRGGSIFDKAEGHMDAARFKVTLQSLHQVGIVDEKLQNLMKAIVIVLQIGNICFEGDIDMSSVSTEAELTDLAYLMEVDESLLKRALTVRTMEARGEQVKVNLSIDAARESCDSFAKQIYNNAFMWLVGEINKATQMTQVAADRQAGVIGLLDIFGFECFETNGFEQLCVNYANEKLQKKFTEDIFRNVRAEYEAEGLALEDIAFDENTDVLDLIEARFGLISILNEECLRPKGNDTDFVSKALRSKCHSPALFTKRGLDSLEFGIRHYARDVVYSACSFVQKNSDTLSSDLVGCAGYSSNAIVASVSYASSNVSLISSSGRVDRRHSMGSVRNVVAPTVWTKYKSGLQNLMEELASTKSWYIRCIKPNEDKKPRLMQHATTLDQLRSTGVVAAVTISRSAFPNRLDNEVALERFSCLGRRWTLPRSDVHCGDITAATEKLFGSLLRHLESDKQGRIVKAFVVGKTKTFFRAGALEFLESEKIRGFDLPAILLQRAIRGFLIRKKDYIAIARAKLMKSKRRADVDKTNRLGGKEARLQDEANKAAIIITAYIRGHLVRARLFRRRQYVRDLGDQLAALENQLAEIERKKVTSDETKLDRLRGVTMDEVIAWSFEKEKTGNASLLQKRAKQIQRLRSQNKEIRSTLKELDDRYRELKEEAKKYGSANEDIANSFEQLNGTARKLAMENASSMKNQNIWKKQVSAMKDVLRRKQDVYYDVAETRERYQDALRQILNYVRANCRDEQLVEDITFIAVDADTEAKVVKVGFDALQEMNARKKAGVP